LLGRSLTAGIAIARPAATTPLTTSTTTGATVTTIATAITAVTTTITAAAIFHGLPQRGRTKCLRPGADGLFLDLPLGRNEHHLLATCAGANKVENHVLQSSLLVGKEHRHAAILAAMRHLAQRPAFKSHLNADGFFLGIPREHLKNMNLIPGGKTVAGTGPHKLRAINDIQTAGAGPENHDLTTSNKLISTPESPDTATLLSAATIHERRADIKSRVGRGGTPHFQGLAG